MLQVVHNGTAGVNMRAAYFRQIVRVGNSRGVTIPKEVMTMIGGKLGDFVRVEIEVVLNESNLHDNSAARSSPQTRDQGIHQE